MTCCYCGELVRREDTTAINIVVSSLWHAKNDTTQHWVAHSGCFAKPLHYQATFVEEMWGPRED